MGVDRVGVVRVDFGGLAGVIHTWPIRRWSSARLSPPRAAKARWLARRANGGRLHAGIDLGAPLGTDVIAPEDGTVVLALGDANNVQGWRGYGPGIVVVRGRSGAYWLLAHVDPIASTGDVVQAGALVARVGQLSWPHVHLEVRARLQPEGGAAVVEDCADPVPYVERGEVVRWSGQCPDAPEDTVKTPRACRPSWSRPPPALYPWPSSSASSSAPTTAPPSRS